VPELNTLAKPCSDHSKSYWLGHSHLLQSSLGMVARSLLRPTQQDLPIQSICVQLSPWPIFSLDSVPTPQSTGDNAKPSFDPTRSVIGSFIRPFHARPARPMHQLCSQPRSTSLAHPIISPSMKTKKFHHPCSLIVQSCSSPPFTHQFLRFVWLYTTFLTIVNINRAFVC